MPNRSGVYLDESATDGSTPIAVVGGLLLDWNRYAWLDMEWERALDSYGIKALHMKNIGRRGQSGGVCGVRRIVVR